jgi:hypothetical protein
VLVEAPLLEGILRGFYEPFRLVPRRRRRFANDEIAFFVDDEGIRHRAARIYGEPQYFSCHSRGPSPRDAARQHVNI